MGTIHLAIKRCQIDRDETLYGCEKKEGGFLSGLFASRFFSTFEGGTESIALSFELSKLVVYCGLFLKFRIRQLLFEFIYFRNETI